MCSRVDIGIKVVECRVEEIEQGRALGMQNRKTDRSCPVPVWGVQRPTGFVEEIRWNALVRWLREWAHATSAETGRDT